MKTQENIANIDDLLRREIKLLEEYKTKKQLLIQAVLLKTIEKEGERICDPACGSGSLLIKVKKQMDSYLIELGL